MSRRAIYFLAGAAHSQNRKIIDPRPRRFSCTMCQFGTYQIARSAFRTDNHRATGVPTSTQRIDRLVAWPRTDRKAQN